VSRRGSRQSSVGTAGRVLGRMLLSGVFIEGGWSTFTKPGQRPKAAAKIGLPHPEPATTLTRANGGAMVVSGGALALGILPRVAATVLIASLVPTTLAGHRFWEQEDEAARRQQMIHFLKNLAALGGLLLVAADDD
jgi:putative oxidoreductase